MLNPLNGIQESLDSINKTVEILKFPYKVYDTLFNKPDKIWMVVDATGYWVFMMLGVGAIMVYVMGDKKALKYIPGSIVGYTILKALLTKW